MMRKSWAKMERDFQKKLRALHAEMEQFGRWERKVKIFLEASVATLEDEINDWLATHQAVKIEGMSVNSSESGWVSVALLYKQQMTNESGK